MVRTELLLKYIPRPGFHSSAAVDLMATMTGEMEFLYHVTASVNMIKVAHVSV